MVIVPDNNVSGGVDNPNSQSIATTISPQASLNKALGQEQQPIPPAAPIPPQTQAAPPPEMQQTQPEQAPPEDVPSSPNEAPEAANNNDPFAAIGLKPIQQAQGNASNPFAAIGLKPVGTKQSILEDPSLENFENIGENAVKDFPKEALIKPLQKLGAMVYGSDPWENAGANRTPIVDKDLKETVGNIFAILAPFISLPEGSSDWIRPMPKGINPEVKLDPGSFKLPDEGVLPKSAGETTQNPDIQRFEEMAGAGVKGAGAQSEALNFRTNKSQAMQDQINKLGKTAEGASKADSMGAVSDVIREEADKSNAGVDAAYDAAREISKNSPVKIPPKNMKDNLTAPLDEIETKFQLNRGVASSKPAENVLQDLKDKFIPQDGAKAPLKWTNIDDLEAWRRNATGIANRSNDPTTSSAIKSMISAYDEYTSNLIDKLPNQNTDAVQAYKSAVSARAAHGAKFENNDMVDRILKLGTKGSTDSIDDITNGFFGSGAIKSKGGMADNYEGLIKAAGDKAPEIQQHLQNGFAQKIFENSIDGRIPGSNAPAISPAKLKTQLTNMFVNQRELASQVYGAEAVQKANDLIGELKLSEKQPKTTNPSGTSYMQDHINKSITSILPGWAKFAINTGKAIFKGGSEAKIADEAAQSFSGKVPARFGAPKTKTPKNTSKGAAVTGILKNAEDDGDGYK